MESSSLNASGHPTDQAHPPCTTTGASSASNSVAPGAANVSMEQVAQWIQNLKCKETQDSALLELSKKREVIPDLAVFLWNTPGTVTALLLEIVDVYTCINPPVLTALQSNRVCNAMALMQCMASHAQTRTQFLEAKIPIYLYPFLLTTSAARPFEYLRLTSLGVIGALVKTDEHDVITFLLNTEIIPLCLKIMETGTELSKTVATFILQKILLDDSGLSYICQTYERFSQVAIVLGKMILALSQDPSVRLLKHVIRCYCRLTDNERAKEALRQCLPEPLKDGTFLNYLREDKSSQHWLRQLLRNLNGDST